MAKDRVTVRLNSNQMLVLTELKNLLNCNISLLIRTIVGKFLFDYEDYIYDILEGRKEFDKEWLKNNEIEDEELEEIEYALDQQASKRV